MTRFFRFVCVSLALSFISACSAGAETSHWTNTTPSINAHHIFKGEINRKGKATGFHYVVSDPSQYSSRIKEILSGPNNAGVYTATVEIWDKEDKVWKSKFSSMFPDRLSKDQILSAILKIAGNPKEKKSGKWTGTSEYGFTISGYKLNDGRVITAFPIYKENE